MCRGGVIHVSQQTLYAQGISEVRKTGHKGIISHQIYRTCLRPAMWAVRVLKVVDSSQNSQGLRSEHNFCMVFAHLEAQPAGPLVDSGVREATGVSEWGPGHSNGPAFTCSRCYDLKGSPFPVGTGSAKLSQCCCSTERSKQKSPAWGSTIFFL